MTFNPINKMSLEFMNAENRNANIHVRCCSFCRTPGHIITNCNDERLNEFDESCRNYIINNGLNSFREFILDQALIVPNIIKAFAIKKCSAIMRNNIGLCISKIISYYETIFNANRNLSQEAQSEEVQEMQQNQQGTSSTENVAAELNRDSLLRILFYSTIIDRRRQTGTFGEIADYLLFMEAINSLHTRNNNEYLNQHRKFDIKTEISLDQENESEVCDCNICYENLKKNRFIKLNCGHEFCKDCVKKTLQNEKKQTPCCAFCRTKITNFEIREEIIKEEFKDLII